MENNIAEAIKTLKLDIESAELAILICESEGRRDLIEKLAESLVEAHNSIGAVIQEISK